MEAEEESLKATKFYIYEKYAADNPIPPLRYFAFDKIFLTNLKEDVLRIKFFLVRLNDAAVCLKDAPAETYQNYKKQTRNLTSPLNIKPNKPSILKDAPAKTYQNYKKQTRHLTSPLNIKPT